MTMRKDPTRRSRRALIGWVVDAQNDFMLKQRPGGRLYVRQLHDPSHPEERTDEGPLGRRGETNDLGAQQILPTLSRAVALFHQRCEQVTYTGDWHRADDPEIDLVAPDPTKGTYPPHCMGMSDDPVERAGAELVEQVRPPRELIVLERGAAASRARDVAAESVATGRSAFIQKNQFSVFTGASHLDEYLTALEEALDAELVIVVCGVATDVCVKHAVDGFLARRYRVILLTDATYGLGLVDTNELVAEWQRRGLVAMSVGEFDEHFPSRKETLMTGLSSSRFVETATAYVGIRQTGDNCLSTVGVLRQLPIGATEEEWGVHFVQQVGVESQREASGKTSHWPLPLVRSAAELAEFGGEAGAMREEPEPGDIFLLWSPAKRRYIRAGIVVAVEGKRQLYDGRTCYDCTTIECVSNRPGASLERKVVRRQRRLTPDAGDCVVRWTDLAPGDVQVLEEAA